MSGSGDGQTVCTCRETHCLQGNCSCFRANLLCSGHCKCKGCRNTKNNKAEVESLYKLYLKRKGPVVLEYNPSVPEPDPEVGRPVPPGFNGCRCNRTNCVNSRCACIRGFHKCTSKCKCQDCANRSAFVGSKGGAGGVSNVSVEAVQTTPSSNTSSSLFRMSGSGDGQTICACLETHCLQGNCRCFKAKSLCSRKCTCKDCQNTENNKAEVESVYKIYLKRKGPVVDSYPSVPEPEDGLPVPQDFNGCKCTATKCASGRCPCFRGFYKCTSKCKCQDCANLSRLVRSDTNTEPGKGGAGGVSNVPEEAVQTTSSRDSRHSNSNKRPRNM